MPTAAAVGSPGRCSGGALPPAATSFRSPGVCVCCPPSQSTHPLRPSMRCALALGPLLPSALQEVAEASSSSSSAAPWPGSTAPADGGMQQARSGSHTGSSSSTGGSSGSDAPMRGSNLEHPQHQPVAGLAQGSSCSLQQPRLVQQQQQQPGTATAAVPPGSAAASAPAATAVASEAGVLFPPSERTQVRNSWDSLMRWSRYFR